MLFFRGNKGSAKPADVAESDIPMQPTQQQVLKDSLLKNDPLMIALFEKGLISLDKNLPIYGNRARNSNVKMCLNNLLGNTEQSENFDYKQALTDPATRFVCEQYLSQLIEKKGYNPIDPATPDNIAQFREEQVRVFNEQQASASPRP